MSQPKGPQIRSTNGELLYEFQPSFRVEGLPKTREVPSLKIDGRNEEIVHPDLIHETSRTISVVGHIYADGGTQVERQGAVQEELDRIMRFIGRKEEVHIHEGTDTTRYIKARYTNIDHTYIDRTARTTAVVRFNFVCHDPFWYDVVYTSIEEDVIFTPPITMLEVVNEGSYEVDPVIWLTGKTEGGLSTKNPKLTNYTTGLVLQFLGGLLQDDVVVVDTKRMTALLVDNNILHEGVARTGSAGIIQLAVTASTIDGAYVGLLIKLVSGTGEGQYRVVDGYNGTTQIVILSDEWDVVPDNTTGYEIYRFSAADGYYVTETQVSATLGTNVRNQMNPGFFAYGFPLVPGTNKIEVEDENSLLKVSILYRKRWL